jgi:hypothetical protein
MWSVGYRGVARASGGIRPGRVRRQRDSVQRDHRRPQRCERASQGCVRSRQKRESAPLVGQKWPAAPGRLQDFKSGIPINRSGCIHPYPVGTLGSVAQSTRRLESAHAYHDRPSPQPSGPTISPMSLSTPVYHRPRGPCVAVALQLSPPPLANVDRDVASRTASSYPHLTVAPRPPSRGHGPRRFGTWPAIAPWVGPSFTRAPWRPGLSLGAVGPTRPERRRADLRSAWQYSTLGGMGGVGRMRPD